MPVNPNLRKLQNLLDYFPGDVQFEDQPRRVTQHTRILSPFKPKKKNRNRIVQKAYLAIFKTKVSQLELALELR